MTTSRSNIMLEHFIREKDLDRLAAEFGMPRWLVLLCARSKSPSWWEQQEVQAEERQLKRVMKEQGYS